MSCKINCSGLFKLLSSGFICTQSQLPSFVPFSLYLSSTHPSIYPSTCLYMRGRNRLVGSLHQTLQLSWRKGIEHHLLSHADCRREGTGTSGPVNCSQSSRKFPTVSNIMPNLPIFLSRCQIPWLASIMGRQGWIVVKFTSKARSIKIQ